MYAWIVAIYFGAILLDVVYSGLLDNSVGSGVQVVYSEVSDLLLLLAGFVVFVGLLAIGFSWDASVARNLFTMSLLVIVVPGILALLVLFPLSRSAPEAAILAYAPLIRLTPIGLASLIGLLGFCSLSRVRSDYRAKE